MEEITGQIAEADTLQWIIKNPEDWTPEEIETVVAPIREHVQWLYNTYAIIHNNYWQIYKRGTNLFEALHISKCKADISQDKTPWIYKSCSGKTATECATSIKAYFDKN
jgi:hypothetical protein